MNIVKKDLNLFLYLHEKTRGKVRNYLYEVRIRTFNHSGSGYRSHPDRPRKKIMKHKRISSIDCVVFLQRLVLGKVIKDRLANFKIIKLHNSSSLCTSTSCIDRETLLQNQKLSAKNNSRSD
jgi:hypothetical protein